MTPRTDTIWAALPAACLLVDPENRITAANPAAEVFLNAGERSLIGRAIGTLLPTDIDLDLSFARARSGQSAVTHHGVRLSRSPRGPVLCDIQIGPLGDPPDLTLLMIHPRQIAGHLGKALQAKSVAKTAIGLADMLAHEIKNPLAGITGAAQLLSMSLGKEDQEMTDLILQETRRIVALLTQVEQFGDLRPPTLAPVNIHDVLERARMSATLGAARKMTFRDEYDPSLPSTPADADQLLQVFANLFANAAQAAGPDGGTITIRTFFELGLRLALPDGGEAPVPLQVEITDDGPGIPEALIDSVFEPFVSSRENGTGLGLALVSKIIAAHHGTIVVASRPGRTTFRLSLPILTDRGDT
jgi:two-component system nitrogen regulation sensor histidine kinase GlnL